jgi:hypothetical protein
VDYAFAASGGHFPVFILYFFFTFLFKEKRIVHNKEEQQQENVQELGDLWLLFSLLILYDWHVCIIGEAGPLQFHIQEKKGEESDCMGANKRTRRLQLQPHHYTIRVETDGLAGRKNKITRRGKKPGNNFLRIEKTL